METENKKRSMVEKQRKDRMMENQGYLRQQMEGATVVPGKGQIGGDLAAK